MVGARSEQGRSTAASTAKQQKTQRPRRKAGQAANEHGKTDPERKQKRAKQYRDSNGAIGPGPGARGGLGRAAGAAGPKARQPATGPQPAGRGRAPTTDHRRNGPPDTATSPLLPSPSPPKGDYFFSYRRAAPKPPGSDRRERRGGTTEGRGGTGARAYARWETTDSAASRTAELPQIVFFLGRCGREVPPPKGGRPSGRKPSASRCRPTTTPPPKTPTKQPRRSSGRRPPGGTPPRRLSGSAVPDPVTQ